MTITSIATQIDYTGNGVTVAFAIPFPFDTSADIKVTQDGAEITTGFTITGGGGSTGTCTFDTAPAADVLITLLDDPELIQDHDYTDNDAFPAESHEQALDRLTRITKRLNNRINQGLRYPDGVDVASDNLELNPENYASKYLAFDSTGKPTPAALSAETMTQETIGELLYPITDAETAAGIAVENYEYAPIELGSPGHLFRYFTDAQIADIIAGTGALDTAAVLQDCIDLLSSVSTASAGYAPEWIHTLRITPGKYRTVGGLTQAVNAQFCHIEGDAGAVLYYEGTGTALHIGNGTNNGVLPAHVKNLNIRKSAEDAVGVGLKVEFAANGYYERISTAYFETGIHVKGSINCVFDGKRTLISSAVTGILIESGQGTGGGLRHAPNLTEVKNYVIGSCDNGVVIQVGSGVTPSGSGGLHRLSYITYENMNAGATAISIDGAGESVGVDTVELDHQWFENFGNIGVQVESCNVHLKHCFWANGGVSPIVIMDDTSIVTIEDCSGYFTDDQPTGGYLVTLGGTATAAAYKNIRLIGSNEFVGLTKLHADWPVNDSNVNIRQASTVTIQYNANYPAGNVIDNHGLALVLVTEINKFFGPDWKYCDCVFTGNDGTANFGTASLRIYRYGTTAYRLKDIDGVGTGYTLTNTTAANATITFNDDGTSRWYQMYGQYTVHQ